MHNCNFRCNGTVLIETALVIPLLLTIAFASFEFSKFMNNSEILSVASREGANAGFRECAFISSDQRAGCINDSNSSDGDDSVVERVKKIIPTSMKSTTDIIVTIFTYDQSTKGIVTTLKDGVNNKDLTPNGYMSKFPPSSWVDLDGKVTETSPVNDTNPVIVVCEIFYKQLNSQYRTMFFAGSAKEVYEATIY